MDSVDNETLINCIQNYRCIYDKVAAKEEKYVERDTHNWKVWPPGGKSHQTIEQHMWCLRLFVRRLSRPTVTDHMKTWLILSHRWQTVADRAGDLRRPLRIIWKFGYCTMYNVCLQLSHATLHWYVTHTTQIVHQVYNLSRILRATQKKL